MFQKATCWMDSKVPATAFSQPQVLITYTICHMNGHTEMCGAELGNIWKMLNYLLTFWCPALWTMQCLALCEPI